MLASAGAIDPASWGVVNAIATHPPAPGTCRARSTSWEPVIQLHRSKMGPGVLASPAGTWMLQMHWKGVQVIGWQLQRSTEVVGEGSNSSPSAVYLHW